MSGNNKIYRSLKKDFIFEIDYITDIGRKMFIFPFIGRTKLTIFCYHFTCSLLCLTSFQLFVTICFNGFNDWFEIVNIAPNLGVCLMILIKYKKIYKHKGLYDKISVHFRHDIWEVISQCLEHKNILKRYTQTTGTLIRCQYYYTIVLAIVVDLFPRLIMFYETDILGKKEQYLYPFDGWYPFDKAQWYYLAYIWEGCMTNVVIFLYAFTNMLHISFTRYICMELKVLGDITEGLISKDDVVKIQKRRIDTVDTHYDIRKKLKFIILKHQFLAKITSELDTVLGDGMLLTYLFGTVFICLTAFTATVVDNVYKSVRYFSFFFSLLVETFVQCILGQLLIDHSEQLVEAIYSADWVYADLATKKMLLVFLMRAQKPFRFSANGYLTMNLQTFSRICSLSYQFFNLLRTAYSE